jgi:hypothetical protein
VVLSTASQSPHPAHARQDRQGCGIIVATARVHRSRLIDVALLCPPCPGSDQIPHRAETTRRANRRHHSSIRVLRVSRYWLAHRRFSVTRDEPALRMYLLIAGAGSANVFVSTQPLEQGLRLLQVRRVEPFGEPAIDRREEFAGFGALASVAPEEGEAAGRAEFPQFRALRLRLRE